MSALKKIISGGQTGADQGGLVAGFLLDLSTGGTAPPRWLTDEGPNEELLRGYGLEEGEPDSKKYRKRTIKNVEDADGTLWMGKESSPGGRLTIGTVKKLGKHLLVNPSTEQFVSWIDERKIKVLNVAGNRERTNPGIKNRTAQLIFNALNQRPGERIG